MSVRASSFRRILHNITNMDNNQVDMSAEKASNDLDELADAPPKAEPTLDAATTTAALPAGENFDSRCTFNNVNGKDRIKSFIRNSGKFESGSGSGDQDGMQMEDGMDTATKKRKTRRGKPKHRKLKPYSQQPQSYHQRLRCRRNRLTKTGRQPPAPYNTNQFLIEDHNDLPDLEQKLSVASEIPAAFQKPTAPPRTRDSSFSVDSDEDYFYSSPEDEEEFLTKEFSSAYEDLHAERLGSLTKSELIQEYIQLEAKVDLLTKRLKGRSSHQSDGDSKNCTGDTETTKKLKIFQQRIDDLIQQNEKLRRENEKLRARRHGSPMSSADSESDSDSSSNGNRSGCCCGHNRSLGSSPVPVSYQSRREKSQRMNCSVSSVDSESDSSSSNDCSCNCPKTNPPATSDIVNGHTTPREIDSLPT